MLKAGKNLPGTRFCAIPWGSGTAQSIFAPCSARSTLSTDRWQSASFSLLTPDRDIALRRKDRQQIKGSADITPSQGNPLTIRGDLEFRAQFGIAVTADPNLETTGFKDVIAVVIQIGKFLRAKSEHNGFRFAGLERDTLESFQFPHGASRTGNDIPDITLRNGCSGPVAGIRHLEGDADFRFLRRRRRSQIAVFEGRVRQPEAERE